MEAPKRIIAWYMSETRVGNAMSADLARKKGIVGDDEYVRAADADALADALESIATRDRRAREIGDEYEVIEDMTAIAVKALAAYRETK